MSKFGSPSFAFLLAGGYDLRAAKLKTFSQTWENLTEQSDGLGDGNEEHTPIGIERATLKQTGAFFDDATLGMHLALRALSQATRILTVGVEGNTIGSGFTGVVGALVTAYDVIVSTAGLTKANATYQIDGTKEEGVILQTHVQQTIDWTNTSVDNAVSSASGGSGFLEVSQFAGITGFVGIIEHSTNNADWVTLITFANVTAAPAAQRLTVAGTVNRYLRFRGDVTGTGTITVFAGFARG